MKNGVSQKGKTKELFWGEKGERMSEWVDAKSLHESLENPSFTLTLANRKASWKTKEPLKE